MNKQAIIFITLLVLGVAFLMFFESVDFNLDKVELPDEVSANLEVESQRPGGFIIAKRVILPSPGFLVVHNDLLGQAGRVIGQSDYFNAGYHSQVVASLNKDSLVGQSLIAVLYEDNGDKIFNPEEDVPFKNKDGHLVAVAFLVLDEALLQASY